MHLFSKLLRTVSILLLILSPFNYAEEVQELSQETIVFPYSIEIGKPIIFNTTYKSTEKGISVSASETSELTLQSAKDNVYIYTDKVLEAKVDETNGLPPGLKEVMIKTIEKMSSLSITYEADATGYPSQLLDGSDLRKAISEMGSDLNLWLLNSESLKDKTDQEKQKIATIVEGIFKKTFPDDDGALSNRILSQGQLIFAATGRELYLGYQSVMDSSRYYDDGDIILETTDTWQIDEINKEKNIAEVSWWSKLNPEKHEEFLVRLKEGLKGKYKKNQVEHYVNEWRKLKFDLEGYYEINLTTGLPVYGYITTTTEMEGSTKKDVYKFL